MVDTLQRVLWGMSTYKHFVAKRGTSNVRESSGFLGNQIDVQITRQNPLGKGCRFCHKMEKHYTGTLAEWCITKCHLDFVLNIRTAQMSTN